jgi:ATP-dependent DNA helicase RecG
VLKVSQFYRGRRNILSATITDGTGQLACFWFNAPYLRTKLIIGQSFFFAGVVSLNAKTGKPVFTQPAVEALSAETIHTGRLVPLYSQTLALKQGSVRRVLKEILDHLAPWNNLEATPATTAEVGPVLTLTEAFKILHFPETTETVAIARERLALEELLGVIDRATQLKKTWSQQQGAAKIQPPMPLTEASLIPTTIPFELTSDQRQAVTELLTDLNKPQPMNRLLLGDVGSGKTVVAGIAAYWTIQSGHNVALVAPTQILAEQHYRTLQQILPDLAITLVTSKSRSSQKTAAPVKPAVAGPAQLFVGTHAILNRLPELHPALLIYDEQHRFGVKHRSPSWADPLTLDQAQPHLLTMSATPIPRSLMLSLFAHLAISTLSQSPHQKLPTKTWVVPKSKRREALTWIKTQLTQNHPPEQGLVVCPFINPSEQESFENVAAATETFQELQQFYGATDGFRLDLLHGQLKTKQKATVIAELFAQKIQLLVTTPIVEVGVDLPAAKLIVIEAAERFGLASLHQLRGRVGRAGQASFCLLFTSSQNADTLARLETFCHEHDGLKLAELDLQRRGAGDLFGTAQHGFDELQFASWTNLTLIEQARQLYQKITAGDLKWQPLWHTNLSLTPAETAISPN